MWWFFGGMFAGALMMAWAFGESVEEMESSLEYHKRTYRYTYDDICEAWRTGFENKPPKPPTIDYDI
jgi:hypothetical protein